MTAFAVVVLLAAGCTGSGAQTRRPGVDVRKVTTDVGLGLERGFEAAPANMVAPRFDRPPPIPPPPLRFPTGTMPPEAPPEMLCPRPGPFDFPKEDAGVFPKGAPTPGLYLWQQDESRVVASFGGIDMSTNFEPRIISRVGEHYLIDGALTFSQLQFEGFGEWGSIVETTYVVIHPSPVQQSTERESDLGAGIYIERILRVAMRPGGPILHIFRPYPFIKLVDLPIENGAEVYSRGVDPVTQSEMTLTGRVTTRITDPETGEERDVSVIEACGERINSWYVDADLEFRVTYGTDRQYPNPFAPPDPQWTPEPEKLEGEIMRASYRYNIAPQLGGMIVGEHIETFAPVQYGVNRNGAAREIQVPGVNADWGDPLTSYRARIGTVTPFEEFLDDETEGRLLERLLAPGESPEGAG